MEQYEVIFYDEDEKTILDKQLVNKGDAVKYKGELPTKAPVNQISYTFIGWIGQEKMDEVTENLVLIAKYATETNTNKSQESLLKASLENARNANIKSTMMAGQKVSTQQKAFEKETRSPEEIVSDILKNGKTEIGQEVNKNDVER